jgi:hypothetical protein
MVFLMNELKKNIDRRTQQRVPRYLVDLLQREFSICRLTTIQALLSYMYTVNMHKRSPNCKHYMIRDQLTLSQPC